MRPTHLCSASAAFRATSSAARAASRLPRCWTCSRRLSAAAAAAASRCDQMCSASSSRSAQPLQQPGRAVSSAHRMTNNQQPRP